jgi:hypothetical protein
MQRPGGTSWDTIQMWINKEVILTFTKSSTLELAPPKTPQEITYAYGKVALHQLCGPQEAELVW